VDVKSLLVTYSKNPKARIRLFCFHYGGTGASVFRDWHQDLPEFVEVVCVQLPGRETLHLEPFLTSLEQVIELAMLALKSSLDRPYIFFGHSLGALISHQLTLRLSANGASQPAHLVVSGRSAPKDTEIYYENISQLPDEEFIKRLPQYGGTPEVVLHNPELMEIYLPILKADFLISESLLDASEALDIPISVFGGLRDRMDREKLGLWSTETTKRFEICMFPGDHFFVNTCRNLVLRKLSSILIEAQSRRERW
jgi:surfactin synthase thioesterase subunit